ncbi:MAG: glycosyltransferase family 4 protein [Chloroflexota bacterium]|nr:MAG: glycosyltransferase family 4 protein [Chloroflexota bacterium]
MAKKLCVLTSVHQSDDGRIFHRESVTLAEAGYDVTFVVPADFELKKRHGVTVRGVKPVARRLARPLVWLRLLRQALDIKPEVVHFHDPELLLIGPLLKLSLGSGVKLIFDVHEYFVDSLADKYWIPARLRPWTRAAANALQGLLLRWVDGVICAVDGLVPLYKQTGRPIAVVRNLPLAKLFEGGIPHQALDTTGFKLIYVGLILPKRGINIVLEAMRLLHVGNEHSVHLYLVGRAVSTDYMTELAEFCEHNGLTDYVHWLGPVPHEELKHYLANADAGLLPGLNTLQYSNPGIATKLFEYLLCELPVISADYPHRRRYIEEAQCGIMVPPEEPGAHAEAVRRLMQCPEETASMGERGRAYVLASYTWESEQARLLDFYQIVLAPEPTQGT